MFITPTQALKRYKVSKPTLYADMNKGKLSFKNDDRGKRKIDVAELDRIYEKKPDASKPNETLNNVNQRTSQTSAESKEANAVEIKYLKEMLGQQKRQYESEIDNLRDSLKLAQEGHNKATLLLEHKEDNRAGDLQKSINTVETMIAEQKEMTMVNQELEVAISEKQELEKSNKLIMIVSGFTVLAVTLAVLYVQGIITLPL